MIIPVGYLQANFVFDGQVGSGGAEITLGFENTTPLSAQGAADFLRNTWNASDLNDWYTDQVTMRRVDVKLGPNSTGASASSTANATGTSNQATVTPNTSILVQKRTNDGGRAGRGRMYLPGAPETVINGSGVVDGTYLGTVETEWNDFAAACVLGGLVPVVLHGAGSPLVTPSEITAFELDALAATQRRRLRR